MTVLRINGTDITPYIKYQGYKWQRSDIDGPNAGRTLDSAYMYRDRLASKVRLDIECRPLTTEEASTVLSAISPEYVSVTYLDPEAGTTLTKEFYSNNIPAQYCINRGNTVLWMGITFPLVER